MSTLIPVPITGIQNTYTMLSKTYRMNFETGQIEGFTDGIDAVNQFIRKSLLTQRYRFLIYDSDYGSEIISAVFCEDASEGFINTVLPRVVKEALLCDERITNVYDFEYKIDGDNVFISMNVDTVYGALNIKENITKGG